MTVTQVTSLEQFIEIVGPLYHSKELTVRTAPLWPIYYQINEDRVVVFEFGPAWSSPIEGMSSMFGRFSRDFPSFDFYKVDDDHRDIMEQAGIPSVGIPPH